MIVIFLDLLTLPVYTRKVEITSLYAQWLAVIYKIRNQPVIIHLYERKRLLPILFTSIFNKSNGGPTQQ